MSFTTREFADRRYPRWLWPAAGAVLLLVVVVLVLVFTLGGGSGGAASPLPPPAAPLAGPPAGPPGGGAGSTTTSAVPNPATTGTRPPADPQYRTAAPAGVTFRVVHGMQLPFSPIDGPLRIEGPVAAGYSHTPQGAALAAAQLALRLLYAPGYEQVITQQSVMDAGLRAKFVAARNAQPQATDRELATAVARSVGFKVRSYTPEKAVVDLAFPNVNGAPNTYATSPYTVVWSGGDWKFIDNSSSPTSTANSLTGYTPW